MTPNIIFVAVSMYHGNYVHYITQIIIVFVQSEHIYNTQEMVYYMGHLKSAQASVT